MKTTFKHKCPVCEFKTTVRCKKPGYREAVSVAIVCSTCQSHMTLRLTRDAVDPKGGRVQIVSFQPSPLASQIIEEEKNEGKA